MTLPAAGRLALGPLDFLPAALREPRRPGRAIIVGWLLSLVGSLVLAALAANLARAKGRLSRDEERAIHEAGHLDPVLQSRRRPDTFAGLVQVGGAVRDAGLQDTEAFGGPGGAQVQLADDLLERLAERLVAREVPQKVVPPRALVPEKPRQAG